MFHFTERWVTFASQADRSKEAASESTLSTLKIDMRIRIGVPFGCFALNSRWPASVDRPSFIEGCTATECLRIGTGNGPQEDRRVQRCLQEHDRQRMGIGQEFSRPHLLALRMQTRVNVKLCFLSPTTQTVYSIPGRAREETSTQLPALAPLFRIRAVPAQITTPRGPGTLAEAPTRLGCIILHRQGQDGKNPSARPELFVDGYGIPR
jgi:hypothetical protein